MHSHALDPEMPLKSHASTAVLEPQDSALGQSTNLWTAYLNEARRPALVVIAITLMINRAACKACSRPGHQCHQYQPVLLPI